MNKAVLISIRPKWCELIASGKKTIEVRKTHPKLDTPFKCYIYCTACRSYFRASEHMAFGDDELYRDENRNIKYGSSIELMCAENYDSSYFLNKKVIGEFVCDRILTVDCDSVAPFDKETGDYINELCCLGRNELWEYTHGLCAYGWRISDLVIYDEPKELGEFCHPCESDRCGKCKYCEPFYGAYGDVYNSCCSRMVRPPQSWCYVEGLT